MQLNPVRHLRVVGLHAEQGDAVEIYVGLRIRTRTLNHQKVDVDSASDPMTDTHRGNLEGSVLLTDSRLMQQ
jgi:hypothetical protein